MEQEIWKDVIGYEGLYQISNTGRVKSFYKEPRYLKPIENTYGYFHIRLSKNKVSKLYLVHRLVALNFIGNSKLQINHKDGNKKNNRIENLEFVTAKQNIRHAHDLGLMKNNICYTRRK